MDVGGGNVCGVKVFGDCFGGGFGVVVFVGGVDFD